MTIMYEVGAEVEWTAPCFPKVKGRVIAVNGFHFDVRWDNSKDKNWPKKTHHWFSESSFVKPAGQT